jgi:hypothetical protein
MVASCYTKILTSSGLLPWDSWGLMLGEDGTLTEAQLGLLDRVARALQTGDEAQIAGLYNGEPGLQLPAAMVVAGM